MPQRRSEEEFVPRELQIVARTSQSSLIARTIPSRQLSVGGTEGLPEHSYSRVSRLGAGRLLITAALLYAQSRAPPINGETSWSGETPGNHSGLGESGLLRKAIPGHLRPLKSFPRR